MFKYISCALLILILCVGCSTMQYVCPMRDYKGDKTVDGRCPKCGMSLEEYVDKSPKTQIPGGHGGSSGSGGHHH
ncbi:MAG: hypothetical protein A2452_06720 [Candidatus Firestonebacteria bacterium RIFOXYC2_FULL_39_67]|nr:MAG: hypothetical protein A2452_06720 [Candidatus Firestonebacteria bacterium RIFOXYC2_FULL_39_67]